MSSLGETLRQTAPGVALMGDASHWTGMDRSVVYRWYTRPESRLIYPEDDHPMHGRIFTAQLRAAYTRDGKGSRAAAVVDALLAASTEFAAVWAEHGIGAVHRDQKRISHPQLGLLELHCQTLVDPDQSQTLLVFTAVPGTESYEKLQLLTVLGDQRI
jgi:hypothetical protein